MAGSHTGRRRTQGGAAAALLAAAFALAALPGCGGCNKTPDYPPNLTFPPRVDRLVLKLPDKPPLALTDPNRREEGIAALDALGGKTLNPGRPSRSRPRRA